MIQIPTQPQVLPTVPLLNFVPTHRLPPGNQAEYRYDIPVHTENQRDMRGNVIRAAGETLLWDAGTPQARHVIIRDVRDWFRALPVHGVERYRVFFRLRLNNGDYMTMGESRKVNAPLTHDQLAAIMQAMGEYYKRYELDDEKFPEALEMVVTYLPGRRVLGGILHCYHIVKERNDERHAKSAPLRGCGWGEALIPAEVHSHETERDEAAQDRLGGAEGPCDGHLS